MPARRLLCVSLEGRTSDALHRFKNLCSVLYSQGYTRRHPGSRRADNCSRDTSAMTSLSLRSCLALAVPTTAANAHDNQYLGTCLGKMSLPQRSCALVDKRLLCLD